MCAPDGVRVLRCILEVSDRSRVSSYSLWIITGLISDLLLGFLGLSKFTRWSKPGLEKCSDAFSSSLLSKKLLNTVRMWRSHVVAVLCDKFWFFFQFMLKNYGQCCQSQMFCSLNICLLFFKVVVLNVIEDDDYLIGWCKQWKRILNWGCFKVDEGETKEVKLLRTQLGPFKVLIGLLQSPSFHPPHPQHYFTVVWQTVWLQLRCSGSGWGNNWNLDSIISQSFLKVLLPMLEQLMATSPPMACSDTAPPDQSMPILHY